MNKFSYTRSWIEIEEMLDKAERKQNLHLTKLSEKIPKKEKLKHMRNYKGLEGAIKALRWTLGDLEVEHPLE